MAAFVYILIYKSILLAVRSSSHSHAFEYVGITYVLFPIILDKHETLSLLFPVGTDQQINNNVALAV